MFGRIFRYWRGILLAGLATLPNIWQGTKWLWDWFGRLDVVVSHLHDLRGLKPVVEFFTNPPPVTIFPSIIVAVVVILWDIRRQDRKAATDSLVDGSNHKLLVSFYLGCAVVAIGVWSAWWITSSPARAIPAPAPSPTPVAPPSPKPAPPPWVSDEEIVKQLSLGRILLRYSPQELFQMYEGNQDLSILVNKWVVVRGPTTAVPVSETVKNREYYKVTITLQPLLWNQGEVVASFDSKKWGNALINIRPGESIRAICQFSNLIRKQPNPPYQMYFDTIVVTNCDAL